MKVMISLLEFLLKDTADTIWPDDLNFDTTYRVTVKYDQDQNIAQLWINASSETDASILGDDEDGSWNKYYSIWIETV